MTPHDAFRRATKLLEAGDLEGLRTLFAQGDAAMKAYTLNGLTGDPRHNPELGPGIVALAVEGASHPSADVRYWACTVIQNQDAWGVDIGPAVEPLLALLGDPEPKVRRMAAYATGNCCKRRFDWSRHFTALQRLLKDQDLYVPEAAAKAIGHLSRRKYDIGSAVGELVRLLSGDDHDEPRKQAARALLHHAGKSPEALGQVRQAVGKVKLNTEYKEVQKFLNQLAEL